MMKKMMNVLFGLIGLLLLLQIAMSALQPFLPLLGFVITAATCVLVVGGTGLLVWFVAQRFRGGSVDDEM